MNLVRVSGGKLEFYNSDGTTRRTVLKHVRMSKGVTQVDVTYNSAFEQGVILHYQDPENFGVALLSQASLSTAAVSYVEFVDGKKKATRATGSSFSLSNGATVTLKCVVADAEADQGGRVQMIPRSRRN